MPYSRFEEGWNKVEEEAIEKIKDALEKDAASNSNGRPRRLFTCSEIIHMKTTVYNLCTNKHAEYGNCSAEVYRRYGEIYQKYLTSTVLPELLEARRTAPLRGRITLLKEFVRRWRNHEIMTFWLEKFFLYLEQWYTKHAYVPKLRQVSMQRFKSIVYDPVKEDTTMALLTLVGKDRRGDEVDSLLIKSSVEVYEILGIDSLDVYLADLESPLLNSTREHYAGLHHDWTAQFSRSSYLAKADAAFDNEERIVSSYLNQSSKTKIFQILKEELLDTVRGEFFDANGYVIRGMIARDRFAELKRLFKLFSEKIDCLSLMLDSYKDFISTVGNRCMAERILGAFYNKCLILADICFGGHAFFLNAFLEYYLDRSTNEDAARLVMAFLGQ